MKPKFKILLLVLISTSYLFAQSREANLEKYFSALVHNQQFNGNVLVAENGKIIYEKSSGYADFASRSPNTKTTLFPVASISKTITATAILQLVQKGKLKINLPLSM